MLLKKIAPFFCCLFLLNTSFSQKTISPSITDKETIIVPGEVSVTKHSIMVGGVSLAYTATVGFITLKNDTGKPIAKIFFTYYKKDKTEPDSRPVTFTFNGGPGSSSVWLHMGGLGPKRVQLDDMGAAPPPPYKAIDNEYTWLDKSDLVFIDPVSTGLSRPASGESASQFHGYNEDLQSVGAFIRNFLDKYERWSSPKYLAGESYGTTRAAGLSSYLQDRYRIFLNGIFLISAVLNFGSNEYYVGNDLPRALYLPTYTAAAWYHKKLAPELQANLQKTLKESEQFALGEFATALLKGGWMTDAEKDKIAEKMSYYTGLSKTYCLQANLRVHESQFFKELRRTDGLTVGRLDGRFTGRDLDDVGETASFDPSFSNIDGCFTATLNDYLQRDLKFKADDGYNIFGNVYPWNYNNVQNQFLNVAESLRGAMAKNPAMKVYVGAGYYDFATPYFTAEYDVEHMFLRPEMRKNIQFKFYEGGHMYYIHKPSLQQLKKDVDEFFKWSQEQM